MSAPPLASPDERSLGDILGEALRPSPDDQPPFDPLAFVLGHYAEVLALQAKPTVDPFIVAMDAVARCAADALGVEHEAALMRLYTIPDNMMCLLDSPEGWTALVEFIAQGFRVRSAPFRVTIH